MERLYVPLYVPLSLAAFVFAACGEDNDADNTPNLITGLSGVVILIIVIWLIARAIRNRP